MTTTRCSFLDTVMACSGSLVPVDNPFNPQNPEATEGTAGHEALARMVEDKDPEVDAIASKYHVDRGAIAMILPRGREAWSQVKQWFPDPVTEYPMAADLEPDVTVTGTGDVLSMQPGVVAVLDWKAGWQPSDHPHQLRGYAALGIETARGRGYDVKEVLAVEVHVRVGTMEIHRWSSDDMEDWIRSLLKQVARAGTQWGPGPVACQYCPRQLVCDSLREYTHNGIAALIAADKGKMTPEKLASLWDYSRVVKRAVGRYEGLMHAALEGEGPIPLDEFRELSLVDTEKDKIIPAMVMRYLREDLELSAMEINACARISKTALCDVVKARVPRGKGAGAIREMLAKLKRTGAIEKVVSQQKRVVRRS
jgi:hypothetical protein